MKSAIFSALWHPSLFFQYCDVKIFAREDARSSRLKSILCHSLVLCSVAPSFKTFLTDPDVEKDEEDFKVVLIPDLVSWGWHPEYIFEGEHILQYVHIVNGRNSD